MVSESLTTWAAITLMTRRLTRRTARPAERRDISPHYLAQAHDRTGHPPPPTPFGCQQT